MHYSAAKKEINEECINKERENNFPFMSPNKKMKVFSLNQHLDLDDLKNYDLNEYEREKDLNDLNKYKDYGVNNKKIKKNKFSNFLKKKQKRNELTSPSINLGMLINISY